MREEQVTVGKKQPFNYPVPKNGSIFKGLSKETKYFRKCNDLEVDVGVCKAQRLILDMDSKPLQD